MSCDALEDPGRASGSPDLRAQRSPNDSPSVDWGFRPTLSGEAVDLTPVTEPSSSLAAEAAIVAGVARETVPRGLTTTQALGTPSNATARPGR
jgi:hypothetical protein